MPPNAIEPAASCQYGKAVTTKLADLTDNIGN